MIASATKGLQIVVVVSGGSGGGGSKSVKLFAVIEKTCENHFTSITNICMSNG